MAKWQVVAAQVELFLHPDSERLQIGKVGMFQIVVNPDGGYKTGDIVVFAPERSILPDALKGDYINTDTGVSYLGGDELNRVKSVRLRGELSEGVTLNKDWVKQTLGIGDDLEIPLNTDLSAALGITKYVPAIPESLAGSLEPIDLHDFKEHDVEMFRLYEREFTPGEEVYAFIKYHGSQVSVSKNAGSELYVTSKGYASDDMGFVRNPDNFYWKSVGNTGALELLETEFAGEQVQLWGEALPCQKGGFTYGFDPLKPQAVFFRLRIDGREIPYEEIAIDPRYDLFHKHWAKLAYIGPFDATFLSDLAKSIKKEPHSGKEMHVNEGIVISPKIPRRSREGFLLMTKILNPKYKGSDEDFS